MHLKCPSDVLDGLLILILRLTGMISCDHWTYLESLRFSSGFTVGNIEVAGKQNVFEKGD